MEGDCRMFTVPDATGRSRLDAWLRDQLPHLSRSRIQQLIKEGQVTVDDLPATVPRTPVSAGSRIRVDIPSPRQLDLVPEAIPLDILFEDDEMLVLNKPAGLVVHPAPGHAGGTLVNALLHYCHGRLAVGGEQRPGIVHRLDKDTSGVMVVARTDAAMLALSDQFRSGGIGKRYDALVAGIPTPARGTITTQIGRSAHDRKRMSAAPARGRRAVTSYELAAAFGAVASRLIVHIETGRTHQIRVHMNHIRHPVLGDRQYGGRRALPEALPLRPARQMLHSAELTLQHPSTRQVMTFHAPWPPDFAAVVDALQRSFPSPGPQAALTPESSSGT